MKLRLTDKGRAAMLNDYELDVLEQYASGRTRKEIAESLGICVKTVEWYRSRITHKTGISGVSGLTRFAIRIGLIAP